MDPLSNRTLPPGIPGDPLRGYGPIDMRPPMESILSASIELNIHHIIDDSGSSEQHARKQAWTKKRALLNAIHQWAIPKDFPEYGAQDEKKDNVQSGSVLDEGSEADGNPESEGEPKTPVVIMSLLRDLDEEIMVEEQFERQPRKRRSSPKGVESKRPTTEATTPYEVDPEYCSRAGDELVALTQEIHEVTRPLTPDVLGGDDSKSSQAADVEQLKARYQKIFNSLPTVQDWFS